MRCAGSWTDVQRSRAEQSSRESPIRANCTARNAQRVRLGRKLMLKLSLDLRNAGACESAKEGLRW